MEDVDFNVWDGILLRLCISVRICCKMWTKPNCWALGGLSGDLLHNFGDEYIRVPLGDFGGFL